MKNLFSSCCKFCIIGRAFAVVCAEWGFTISEAEVGYVTWPAIKAENAGRSRVSQATRILLFRKT
jgi:hypothetical protein